MLERGRRPTLVDVAAKAGVSVQTVSNYLTGRNIPRSDNLGRIRGAIEQLGYQPSAAARTLRSRNSRIIGFVFEDAEDASENSRGLGLREPLHGLLLEGAVRAARTAGYDILTVLAPRGKSDQEASRLLSEGRVDGILCSISKLSPDALRRLTALASKYGVPVGLCQEKLNTKNLWTVAADDTKIGHLVFGHLYGLGHRAMMVLDVEPRWPGPARRSHAFMVAASKHKLNVRAVRAEAYSKDVIQLCVSTVLKGQQRPTAIFAVNDVIAAAVIQRATELGLVVPNDLSVVGCGGFEIADQYTPAISTVAIPAAEIGAEGVRALISGIERLDRAVPHSMVLDVELITRASSGASSGAHSSTRKRLEANKF